MKIPAKNYAVLLSLLIAGLMTLGCEIKTEQQPPADAQAVEQVDESSEDVGPIESGQMEDSTETTVEPVAQEPSPQQPETPAWKYTEEQMAEAKDMANQLSIVVKEDANGNVIGIDTAAKRAWADDYQMEMILVFPGLKSLTLEGPSITDMLAPRIAESVNLESLALRNAMIGDSGVTQLTGLKSLKVIDLRIAPMLTDAGLETLADMPSLRAVRLVGCNIGDQGVESLLKLPQLTELDVRSCRNVTKDGIALLKDKPSVRTLKIGGPEVTDEFMDVVAELKQVTSLTIDNASVTDDGIAKLAGLPLTSLTIYQCANVTDAGLEKILDSYPDLTALTLRDTPATGKPLALLTAPEKIVSLNIAQSAISDDEMEQVARMTNLETLILLETGLTDASVEQLAKLKNLKTLMVAQTGITADGVAKLREALPDCDVK